MALLGISTSVSTSGIGNGRGNRIRIIASVLFGIVFSLSLASNYWALGIFSSDSALPSPDYFTAPFALASVVFTFAAISIVSYGALSATRLPKAVASWTPPQVLAFFCQLNIRSILITAFVMLVLWTPVCLINYPGIIDWDTINQLYQYNTHTPTWYPTLGEWLDAEYIDHHPVFDTVVYGLFVYGIGELTSQNVGVFTFVAFQGIITSTAFAITLGYMEKLHVPPLLRFVAFLFFSLFPVFPYSVAFVVKDTLHAPLFVLYAVMFVEACRTKGKSLESPSFFIGFIVVSVLCMLTKKTGLYIVSLSGLALLLSCRRWRATVAFIVPVVLVVAVLPAFLYPALGIAKGGAQELFGMPFQQTTTVAINAPNDVSEGERTAIGAVMNLDKAIDRFDSANADGAKNTFRQDASPLDVVRYFETWLSQGIRHPNWYLKSMLLCNGSLYTPVESFKTSTGIEQEAVNRFRHRAKETNQKFNFEIHEPDTLKEAAETLRGAFDGVANAPLVSLLFAKGFYGGWIPMLCFILLLLRDRRRSLWILPSVLSACLLIFCPVDYSRYVFPMLYTAPLIMAVAISPITYYWRPHEIGS